MIQFVKDVIESNIKWSNVDDYLLMMMNTYDNLDKHKDILSLITMTAKEAREK